MDTVYRVVIDYELRGDVDRPVGRATGKLGELDRSGRRVGGSLEALGGKVASFGGAVADAFTSAVEHVGSLGAAVAGIGVAGALAAVTYGATHLNSELEQTNLSLAAIFQAQGYTSTFADAMSLAADEVTKMKSDVKSLPGDLGQLAGIMKTIATPGAQAGLTPDAIRQLSGRAMLVGGIEQLPPDLVARELAQLLSGRAGAHNILGTRLGLIGARGQSFNAESASARATDIGKEFDRFGPAAEAFGQSFFANWTTLKDNVKYTLLAPVTSPLFESVKRSIKDVNAWFDGHRGYVASWAEYLGDRIAGAFEWGEVMVLEWWPAIETFATSAYSRLAGLWHELEPVAVRVSGAIKESLANGSALDKIESILKLYGAVRVARGLSPLVGSGLSALGGASGGGGAAAGAAGLLGGVAGATAGAALVVGGVAAGGEALALSDLGSAHHGEAVAAAKELSWASGRLAGDFEWMWARIKPGVEWFGAEGTLELAHFGEGLDSLLNPTRLATDAVDVFAGKLSGSGGMLEEFSIWLSQLVHHPRLNPDEAFSPARPDYELSPGTFVKRLGESVLEAQKKLTPKPGGGGGGGGTNIQKVEIVISTNEEPSRVARRVADILADIGRHPTASRHAPNFSRARM